jgi:predicted DNA binding CopG/RHH family protein
MVRRDKMREEYDIEKLNPRPNPYTKVKKVQITINITEETVKYFKEQAGESGIPYQNLMNMYLTDCAKKKKKPHVVWE